MSATMLTRKQAVIARHEREEDAAVAAHEGGSEEESAVAEQDHGGDEEALPNPTSPARSDSISSVSDDSDEDEMMYDRGWRGRRRNRVRFLPTDFWRDDDSDDSEMDESSEGEDWGINAEEPGDSGNGSPAASAEENEAAQDQGEQRPDRWDALVSRIPGALVQSLPQYIRGTINGGRREPDANAAAVVDLEDSQEPPQRQEPTGPQDEIDLTLLPSDDEATPQQGGPAGANDDDDEVEIVRVTAPQEVAAPARPPGRKRRRAEPQTGPSFDTQRAESTSISMENNEVIEHFKQSLKCSVCLDVIDEMTSTICGHVYCGKCIRLAIRVTQKCPLCQRDLRPTDIHGLYF